MSDQPRKLNMGSPEYWKIVYHSEHEPHWAIRLLHDPRGQDWDALVEDGEYMELGRLPDEPVTLENALGFFDKEAPGWVPMWFPREVVYDSWRENERRVRLSAEERLDWFDKALAYYAQTEWPPTGSLQAQQRAVVLSLLRILYVVKLEYGQIPTPDEM